MASRTPSRTRAQSMRERRATGSTKNPRRNRRKNRVGRSTSLPPVMVRTGKIGPFKPGNRRKKNRRRFDVSLGITGAEVRLPAIPTVRLGWRIFSGFLVVLLLGILYTLWNLPTFQVIFPEISGIKRLTSQEVDAVLNVAGKSIFEIEPKRLTADLQEAFPELYNIAVQVQFPAEVVVTVEERQPALAWSQEGLTLWVDELGVAFPPRGEAELPVTVEALNSPAVVPPEAEGSQVFIDPALIPAILTVGKNAPPENPIIYDSKHGLGWRSPDGWQVFLGMEAADIDIKLEIYESLVETLDQGGLTPTLISIEHVDAPYYRLDR